MPDTKLLDDLARRISTLAAASPAADLDRNLRALLAGVLGRFDLVSREEFDVQREMLRRACERLAEMETRIAELEGGPGGGR